MKRKKLGVFLIAMTLLCGAAGLAACEGGSAQGGGNNAKVEITGFNVKEEMTVPNGSIVCPESMLVTDSNGEIVNVWVEVTNSKGGIVSLNANAFNATDLDGYTITYVIRASDGQTYRKTTKVNVEGEAMGINLSAKYDEIVETGKPLTIEPICEYDNATYAYEVSCNGEAVEVAADGTFTPTSYGEYDVKIKAQAGDLSAEYKYTFFARSPVQKGEIEKYDEEWAAYASYVGDMRMSSWSITDTEASGVKNHHGLDDTYLSSKTSLDYIPYYLMPRNGAKYYEALAEEGYEYISGWVYIACDISHISLLRLDGDLTSSFYQASGPTILANTWTKISYRLVDTAEDWERSFASACEYYRENAVYFMLIDNSNAYNPGGHQDDLEIYYNDFYAIKPITVNLKENIKTEYKIGETFKASDYFNEQTIKDGELAFTVTVDGETSLLTDGYAFNKNSNYEINVFSSRPDYEILGDTKFTVSASFELNTQTDAYNAAANTEIDLIQSFGVTVKGFNLTGATFKCDNPAAKITGTKFTAAFGGTYDVYMTEIVVNGKTEKLPKAKLLQVTVDGYEVTLDTYENVYEALSTPTIDLLALGTSAPTDLPSGYVVDYKLFAHKGAKLYETDGEWTDSVLSLDGLNGRYTALAVAKYGEYYLPFLSLTMDVLAKDKLYASANAPILAAVTTMGEKYDENVSSEYVGNYDGRTNVTKLHSTLHSTLGVSIDPAYAHSTFRTLNSSGLGYYVVFQYKIENASVEPRKTTFNGNVVGGGAFSGVVAGEWHTFTMKIGDATHEHETDLLQKRYTNLVTNYRLAQAQTNPTETIKNGYLMNLSLGGENVNIYVTLPKLVPTDKSEKLVDLNTGSSEFDLTTVLDTSDFNAITHELVWSIDGVTCTGSKVDASTLTDGSHTLTLVAKPIPAIYSQYIPKQEITVYNGVIDVFDSSEEMRFVEISQSYIDADYARSSKYDNAHLLDVVSIVNAAGVTADTDVTMGSYVANGNYYLYDMSENTKCEHGLWIKALHSKAYYELMKEKGYTAVTYDYYIVDPNGVTGNVSYNGETHTSAQKNAWQTATISIDNIIEYYEHYSGGLAYYPNYPDTTGGHYRYTEVLHLSWKAAHNAKFYVGNFRSVK